MKILVFFAAILTAISSFGQSIRLDGVYLARQGDINMLLLAKNGYGSMITYKDDTYLSTKGGPFTFDGTSLHVTWEYDDENSATVGTQASYTTKWDKGTLEIEGIAFKKQAAKVQQLDGVWRITGRQNAEGTMNNIPRGDRKTIKILVDGYFQWIAINPANKGFYGTGGGTYSFVNGKYTENIVFFSRDNSRVGATLNFEGAIKDGAWHHSGLSSKGDPIYEVWSVD